MSPVSLFWPVAGTPPTLAHSRASTNPINRSAGAPTGESNWVASAKEQADSWPIAGGRSVNRSGRRLRTLSAGSGMEHLSPPSCPTALPSTGPSASSLPVEGAGAAQGRPSPTGSPGLREAWPILAACWSQTIKDPPQRRTGKDPAPGTHRGAPGASVLRLRQSPPRLVPAPSSPALHLLGSPRGRPVGGGGPGAGLKEGLSCPFLPAPRPSERLGFERKRLLATAVAGRYAHKGGNWHRYPV